MEVREEMLFYKQMRFRIRGLAEEVQGKRFRRGGAWYEVLQRRFRVRDSAKEVQGKRFSRGSSG